MVDSRWGERTGPEARKSFSRWLHDGFIANYLSGDRILDVGYKGHLADVVPILPNAIGVDLDYPGYDGKTLPFESGSQDAVFTSHTLEHIEDYRGAIAEWFRVLRVGGHLVITVPHQFLYERSLALPSKFNRDHRRLYTPASLMLEIEEAIDPCEYRVRLLKDNDVDFDYSIPPERHAAGCYEILLVLEKIARPSWADALLLPQEAQARGQGSFPVKPPLLLTNEWTHAGNGALSDVLGKGWSGSEEWGVWGVGELHELLLFVSAPGSADLELEADVYAVLIGARIAQDIDIVVAGKTLTTWRFTVERNRAQRAARIPAALVSAAVSAHQGVLVVTVEFRPRFFASPKSLDFQNQDNRPLGLGLHAIRLRTLQRD